LGVALGLDDPTDALGLLAACDEVGVDAKEAGAALEVWARARALGLTEDGPSFGVAEDFSGKIRDLARGEGEGWALSLGAEGLAERFGLEAPTSRGEALRPRHGVGGTLAAEVAARGAEPMRTFAFLLEGGIPRERAAKIVAPLGLSSRGLDPEDAREKGRLVWWHENFVAAIDSTGFCAFSAAGALADGVMELEELAAELLGVPTSSAAREEFLSRGAALCLLALEVTGPRTSGSSSLDELMEPWEEYRALRGLDSAGAVLPEVAAGLGRGGVLRWDRAGSVTEEERPAHSQARGDGELSFSGTGELGHALGDKLVLSVELPLSMREALEVLSRERAEVRKLLFVNESPIATGWRDGERVDLDDQLADGDHLDLVLAVGGG